MCAPLGPVSAPFDWINNSELSLLLPHSCWVGSPRTDAMMMVMLFDCYFSPVPIFPVTGISPFPDLGISPTASPPMKIP